MNNVLENAKKIIAILLSILVFIYCRDVYVEVKYMNREDLIIDSIKDGSLNEEYGWTKFDSIENLMQEKQWLFIHTSNHKK